MSMTEEEAREKWCPFVRCAENASDGNSANRIANDLGGDVHPWNCCIASECMAWRKVAAPEGGYCGLAGRGEI